MEILISAVLNLIINGLPSKPLEEKNAQQRFKKF